MQKHFVTFFSPGTFVHETSELPIDSWDVDAAVKLASTIRERHGATPFAFQFSTRGRSEKELDSKVVKESPRYFLGGDVFTVEQLEKLADPSNNILIQNMKGNGWKQCVINRNSWKIAQPLNEGDVVLPYKAPKRKAA